MDEDPFASYGLRAVQLTDQPTFSPYFASLACPLSDYTFSQLYTWRNSLRILWTILDRHLCVFANGSGDLTLLMPPIGDTNSAGALRSAFALMDEYNAARGALGRSRVEYASQELLSRCGEEGWIIQPMGADYVYDTPAMVHLEGGALASKRQAKNRFMRNYAHRVETYDAALHLEGCRRLLDTWKIHQDAQHLEECNLSSIKRSKETLATDLTLTCAPELGLRGLVVQVEGEDGWQIRGFTFGEHLGQHQSSITIEKTDLTVKGLAQFIFSEFCGRCWTDRPRVNVGDDWGLETLAWTKMSYRPVQMLNKYVISRTAPVRVALSTPPGREVPAESACAAPIALDDKVTIRDAARDDLAAAVDIERQCFTTDNLNKRQLQYLQTRKTAVFLVAQQGEQVIGEGIALVRKNRRGLSGRIYSLAVRPDARRRKVGQQLLEAMIQTLRERGVRRIYLEVDPANNAALQLYRGMGFRKIGVLPNYFGDGQDGVHLMFECGDSSGVGAKELLLF